MKMNHFAMAGAALLTSAALAMGSAFAADKPAEGELSTIMKDLAVNMDQIQAGLWANDLASVSKAAAAIAHHPKANDTERQRILGVMGADMGKFKAADGVVHESAARLSEAAAKGDMDASLTELATMQGGCVGCHSSFRSKLRD